MPCIGFPSQMAVIDMLGKVCGILPSSYRDQCKNLIEKYGKKLMDMLLSYINPEAICTLIQVCHGMETLVSGEFITTSSLISPALHHHRIVTFLSIHFLILK